MSDIRFHVDGLERAQDAIRQTIIGAKETGGLGRATKYVTLFVEYFARLFSPVWTGTLKASHRIRQEASARFIIYIDPSVIHPIVGKPSHYGPIVHAMGGRRAFYQRAVTEPFQQISGRATAYIRAELP